MSATQLTFGEIRFVLQKRWPGLDADLLDFHLSERYRRVMRRLDWQRLKVQAVIQTPAIYETGAVAVTAGSAAVTGAGTTFTNAMSGLAIRIGEDNEYYQFTRVDATTGTLDRAYEGDTDAAASFKIWQSIYPLPADLRALQSMRLMGAPRDMDAVSQEYLDELAPHRSAYGNPAMYAPHMEDLSTPPRQQVEVYPIPDAAMGLVIWYTQDPTLFSASSTANFLATWLNPTAIFEGVRADALGIEKDYAGADRAEAAFERAIAEMIREEARKTPNQQIKLDEKFTRHRADQWTSRNPGWSW